MLDQGQTLKTRFGRKLVIERLLDTGGQAEIYLTKDLKTGRLTVLKKFHHQFAPRPTVERIQFLIAQRFPDACPEILAPFDLIENKKFVAHLTDYADGQSLEEHLVTTKNTLKENILIAMELTRIMAELHRRGIAHGDLHAYNIRIRKNGAGYVLYLIDLDNYYCDGVAPPPMIGQRLYLAPELQVAMEQDQPALPDIFTELFALGILIHEIVLLKHIAAGADADEQQFLKAMYQGHWLHDPANAEHPLVNPGGYPVKILNAELARYFRLALSHDRDRRTTAEQWHRALENTLDNIHVCSHCGGDCIIDASKIQCPFCGRPYPALQLRVNGTIIDLQESGIMVGRANLNGTPLVSMNHAVFRRIGPQTWMESVGRNGTWRWSGSQWIRLPDKKPVLVQKNDQLKFADLEVTVCEIV